MIRLKVAACLLVIGVLAGLDLPATAQEHVIIGTQRLADNGALFLAASEGYFKAEGIDLGMTAYESDAIVAETLAAGATDFGLAALTPAAFNLAGKGLIRAIAAQVREKGGYEGTQILASNIGFNKGVRKFEDLAGRSVAISALGSVSHYQLEQVSRIKHIDIGRITIKPLRTFAAITRAVGANEVDAAILPAPYAHELLLNNQAKLVGWYSELDEQQLGALFVAQKMIETRREVVEKFMRAYRRGVADYTAALLRKDRSNKRVSDTKSREAATIIARYVYPDRGDGGAAAVELATYFIEPQARLDVADIERQIAWYKGHGLIDKNVGAGEAADLSFNK